MDPLYKPFSAKLQKSAQQLVYTLAFLLVFEGLLRKILPSAIGLIIFFMKDVLCLYGLTLVNKAYFTGKLSVLFNKWKSTLFAFIPVALATTLHDPILAVFGLKQYLLFAVIGLLVPMAFPSDNIASFRKFVTLFSVLLIPTTGIAVLQNSLPASHWLNKSVTGDSLEAFSAAGYLRVSSTFAFTGQYSWFLNVVCVFLITMYFLPKESKAKAGGFIKNMLPIVLIMCLVIGVFITGGRTAVLGCAVCIIIGFGLSAFKAPKKIISKGIIGVVMLLVFLTVFRAVKPEFFAAYDKRSTGNEELSQSDEIENRMVDGALGWTKWLFVKDPLTIVFGTGIGLLSNGSEKISNYASVIKSGPSGGIESDYDTTALEGGLYLMFVWYLFRFWVILFCFKIWRGLKNEGLGIAVSFLLGYVILVGSFGVIGKQPPANIWWWLTIGSIMYIGVFDNNATIMQKRERRAKLRQPAGAV